MAAVLRLPTNPAARHERIAGAAVATGMATVSGAIAMAMIAVFQHPVTGADTESR